MKSFTGKSLRWEWRDGVVELTPLLQDSADLNDLVSYLREKCCWDSDSPPANPRYRAN